MMAERSTYLRDTPCEKWPDSQTEYGVDDEYDREKCLAMLSYSGCYFTKELSNAFAEDIRSLLAEGVVLREVAETAEKLLNAILNDGPAEGRYLKTPYDDEGAKLLAALNVYKKLVSRS